MKRMIQNRENKHLSVVAGKLSVLEHTEKSLGRSSTVSFGGFYCYGKYMLCARKKKNAMCFRGFLCWHRGDVQKQDLCTCYPWVPWCQS